MTPDTGTTTTTTIAASQLDIGSGLSNATRSLTVSGLTNAHLSGSAGITYANLSLTGSIQNADLAGGIADGKLASSYLYADGTRALTGDLTLANSNPSNALHAASKGYVDSVATGLSDFKESVVAASTANVAIATALVNGAIMDGVTLSTGDRVLLKDQTTASENGIYIVAASGAASRSTDADASEEVTAGMYVFVEAGGTVNGNKAFVLATADPITLGTTNLSFVAFSSVSGMDAGDGISISGTTVSLASSAAGAGLTYTAGVLDIVSGNAAIAVNANDITLTLATGSGLSTTGGLGLASSVAGTGLSLSAGVLNVGGLTNAELSGSAGITNANLANSSVTYTAGAGLTGGGTVALGASATLDIGAGTGISVSANDVAIDQTFSPTWSGAHTFSGGVTIAAGGKLDASAGSALLPDQKVVVAATTANIVDLAAGAPNTVDGVSLSTGDRVLVRAQSTAAQNGIYTVDTVGTGTDGAWSRAGDSDTASRVSMKLVAVRAGSTLAGTQWFSNKIATLGTDAISYKVQNSSLDGDGLTRSSTDGTLSVLADGTTITVGANGIKVTANTISESHLTASVAGTGISGGNGTALSVDFGSDVAALAGSTSNGVADTAARSDHTHARDVARQEYVDPNTITGTDTAISTNLVAAPVSAASLQVFLNGVLMVNGAGKDYTLSGQTVTWLAGTGTAPDLTNGSDVITYVYQSQGV